MTTIKYFLSNRITILFFGLLSLICLVHCTTKPEKDSLLVPKEDSLNLINTAVVENGKIISRSTSQLPKESTYYKEFELKDEKYEEVETVPSKIHPLLQRKLSTLPGHQTEIVVITFKDDVEIPRFPEPKINEPRNSDHNKKAMEKAQQMAEAIQKRRAKNYQQMEALCAEQFDAKIIERFWLISAMTMELPLKSINGLLERQDILYIEPQQTEDLPPQDSNNNNDVDDGRARIVSDPYFNLDLPLGWIGLLDSGVQPGHILFNRPSNIDFMRDCVNGGSDCNTGSNLNPNDDCWDHGTATAAIITGNTNQGNAFRGVTGITLDNFKVYPTSFNSVGNCNGGLNTTAAIRGFQNAVLVLDRVIVAEMQGSGGAGSSISVAADNAFDAGAVIIAANGNNGPSGSTVNVPAVAHKVLGVGNFDVQSANQVNAQSRGPAPDKRFKPDIQAPTNTETASNASNTAFRIFTGTSGATPYASGAAALLRNWLRGNNFSIDPGQVYAQMILSGQQLYPFNNTSGAGPIQMPTNGTAWWGKVSVSDGETIDIPINMSGGNLNTFDGALWWPENNGGDHNDIDLYLISPNGSIADFSWSIPSVFERARRAGSVIDGTWILRIRGYKITGNQTVYWTAHVRK